MNDPLPESIAPTTSDLRETTRADAAGEARAHKFRASRLVLVVVLALLAGVWYDGFQRAHQLEILLAKRLAEADQLNKESRALAQQAQETVRDLQAKTALLEARFGEAQTQQVALEALYRELTPGRDEMVMTEIEQMLLLAGQQLQLAGNVQNALAAVQAADTRLQRLNRPQFTGLRRALAKDIDKLKAQPVVDVTGMSLRLDQLIAGVDKFPFALDERIAAPKSDATAAKDENRWIKVASDFWTDIKGLVRIERMQQNLPPLLPPSQQFFVRESVLLRLLTARQALLARDDASFHADLRAAEDMLKRYFDQRPKPTQVALTVLKQLQTTTLSAETPDLSVSLDAVRALRLARDRSNR
jgi:uroporphyrin-III C-methyltransferase